VVVCDFSPTKTLFYIFFNNTRLYVFSFIIQFTYFFMLFIMFVCTLYVDLCCEGCFFLKIKTLRSSMAKRPKALGSSVVPDLRWLDLTCLLDSRCLSLSLLPDPSWLGLSWFPDPTILSLGGFIEKKGNIILIKK
jgi:hypothetical protein